MASAAASACDGWFMTRAFGYGKPRLSSTWSCNAFDVSCVKARAIDDANADFLEVIQIIERVEDAVGQAALPGGGAHAIEDQRVFRPARGHIIRVMARVDLVPRRVPQLHLLKQGAEPIGMLVVNPDGLGQFPAVSVCSVDHHFSISSLQKTKAAPHERPGKTLASAIRAKPRELPCRGARRTCLLPGKDRRKPRVPCRCLRHAAGIPSERSRPDYTRLAGPDKQP